MTEFEKMMAGRIYDAFDEEVAASFKESHQLTLDYNNLKTIDKDARQKILHQMFPADDFGDYRTIEAPLFIDNVKTIKIGRNFFADVHLTAIAASTLLTWWSRFPLWKSLSPV